MHSNFVSGLYFFLSPFWGSNHPNGRRRKNRELKKGVSGVGRSLTAARTVERHLLSELPDSPPTRCQQHNPTIHVKERFYRFIGVWQQE